MICPLGALQEFFGLAGRKIFKRRLHLPRTIDKIFRYLKYPILILFIASAWKTMTLAIRPYDPWVAYHHLASDEFFSEYLIGTLILGASLLVGLFLDRPFCRYLCPVKTKEKLPYHWLWAVQFLPLYWF
jgi:polyferredoxin